MNAAGPGRAKVQRRRRFGFEREMEQPNSQNEIANKAFHPYGAQGAPRVNADVRTENERCGTRQSKGATAMRMPAFGNGNETAEQPK